MRNFSNLSGTSKTSFYIGIKKWLLDASAATVLRTLTLGNRSLDLSGGNSGDVLQILSSTSIGWAAAERGNTLKWVEVAGSPESSIDAYGNQIYSFVSGLTQNLKAVFKVPTNYVSGRPINLKFSFYSNDTSGTVLLQTVATLIRSGTDLISSTTNQRTSTNSALTQSGGTQNIPQIVTCDLTSTTGQINGVNVSANDLILISLKRGTDTAASDVSAMPIPAEVTTQ